MKKADQLSIPMLEKLVGEEADEFIAKAIQKFEEAEHQAGARGALTQFDITYSVHRWVQDDKWKSFCAAVALDPVSETTEKTISIGEDVVRATAKLEEWESFGLLYACTMLTKPKFERFFQWGRSAEGMGSKELREGIAGELVEKRRPFR